VTASVVCARRWPLRPAPAQNVGGEHVQPARRRRVTGGPGGLRGGRQRNRPGPAFSKQCLGCGQFPGRQRHARPLARKPHDRVRIRRPPPGTGLRPACAAAGDGEGFRLDRFGVRQGPPEPGPAPRHLAGRRLRLLRAPACPDRGRACIPTEKTPPCRGCRRRRRGSRGGSFSCMAIDSDVGAVKGSETGSNCFPGVFAGAQTGWNMNQRLRGLSGRRCLRDSGDQANAWVAR